MLSRLPRLAVVAALACTIGLHWAFFQSVAWLGMVVSYSQNATLTEAFQKTFDGKHPCPLCKQIAKSKKADKKSEFPQLLKKFEFLDFRTGFALALPPYLWGPRPADSCLKSLQLTPPTPPPRLSFA